MFCPNPDEFRLPFVPVEHFCDTCTAWLVFTIRMVLKEKHVKLRIRNDLSGGLFADRLISDGIRYSFWDDAKEKLTHTDESGCDSEKEDEKDD